MKIKTFFLLALSFAATACGSTAEVAESSPQTEFVNVGYGSMTKEENPYAVSKVDLEKGGYRHYNSIYDMLSTVPGVHVSGTDVTVRGIVSINGSTDPLFLVDGTAVNTISSLNPEEIHNIEVLKDGSTAMYGMRGAAGVILITTKAAYATRQAEKEARTAARAARKDAKKK